MFYDIIKLIKYFNWFNEVSHLSQDQSKAMLTVLQSGLVSIRGLGSMDVNRCIKWTADNNGLCVLSVE